MATNRDKSRTLESKINTQAVRTVRKNRRVEQQFTNRAFNRLIERGL